MSESLEKNAKAEEKRKKAEEKKALKAEKKASRQKMSKKKKRNLVLASLAGVVLVFFVVNSVFAKEPPMQVNVVAVHRGDIEETLSTSGQVDSQEVKTYFSEVAGTIGEVAVALGDTVEAGTKMITYNMESAEKAKRQAELQELASNGSYQNSLSNGSKNQAEFNEATVNLEVLNQQIEDEENYIKELKAELDEKQTKLVTYMNQIATNLNVDGIELQNRIKDKEPGSTEYNDLQEEIKNNQIQQVQVANEINMISNNGQLKDLQDRIAEEEDKLAHYKTYKSEMESQKAGSENAVINSYQRTELDANRQIAGITAQSAKEDYEKALAGVTAEFKGVVTELTADEGAVVANGGPLVTLADMENVKVNISLTKYDLEKVELGQKATITISGHEYNGEITKINKMATVNSSGTSVVGAEIKILNPDENIFLGIEAKVLIHTQKAEQALLLPVEAVNADKEGDFVYVVENGVVTKKKVSSGISTDEQIQIIEGLNESDQVITGLSVNVTEGMQVTPVPVE